MEMDESQPEGEEEEEKEMFVGATASILAAEDRAALFAAIDTITGPDASKRAAAVEAVAATVRKYQALPAVLDNDLTKAVGQLITFCGTRLQRESGGAPKVHRDEALDAASAAVYELCAVRGHKKLLKFFPHTIGDLEPCYVTLTNLDGAALVEGGWRTRYTLLLWLRMLILNPFDVETIAGDGRSFVSAVVGKCTALLEDSGPSREAAALCLSALLTRRDVDPIYLRDFVEHVAKTVAYLGEDHRAVFAANGALAALAAAYKAGARLGMREVSPRVLEAIGPLFEPDRFESRALRRSAIKLSARIGCAMLKPRVATWCYSRGKRDLLSSMATAEEEPDIAEKEEKEESDDEDDLPSEELLEEVVDQLLVGLREAETVSRWSAAKGIGRIASRLPREVADDIVGCVLEMLNDDDKDVEATTEEAMHGACLALAECGRLGVLLPSRVGAALTSLSTALRYDGKSAASHHSSSGANVRDAACYVAWTFARAFEPEVIAAGLEKLSVDLVLAALFDRELHVRRAASAALQENVGRQGHAKFNRGIELLTLADFFALANREEAYVGVAPKIAALGEPYKSAIVAHVVQDRLNHWDSQVRSAASRCLGELVKLDASVVSSLDCLLDRGCQARELAKRHGGLLGAAEVVKNLDTTLNPELASKLIETVPKLESARLYRGRGGESIRVGACRLIQSIAIAGVALTITQQLRLLETLEESAIHALEDVRKAAVDGMRDFTLQYFGKQGEKAPSARLMTRTIEKYVTELNGAKTASQSRGWARVLGSMPRRIFVADAATLEKAIGALARRAKQTDRVGGARDAETRRDALRGLREVVGNLESNEDLSKERVRMLLFDVFASSAEDYGVDRRGDVGSWARIEALHAACELGQRASNITGRILTNEEMVVPCLEARAAVLTTEELASMVAAPLPPPPPASWGSEHSELLTRAALRQAGERLDAVRNVALLVLKNVLVGDCVVAAVPFRNELIKCLFQEDKTVFERLCECSLVGPYHDAVLSGLVSTAGTGASNNPASRALKEHSLRISTGRRSKLLQSLIALVGGKQSRLSLPALKCLRNLLDAGAFAVLCAAPPSTRRREEWTPQEVIAEQAEMANADDHRNAPRCLVTALLAEAKRPRTAKDVKKCCALSDALLATLLFSCVWAPTTAKSAVVALLGLLVSPYPRARAYVAEQLYSTLLEVGLSESSVASPDDLEFAQNVLSEQQWDGAELDDLRTAAQRVAQRLGLGAEFEKAQEEAQKKDDGAAVVSKDELESYASLVKDAGY